MSLPSGPFAEPACVVGGTGGSPFTACGWVEGEKTLVAKRLDVWHNLEMLNGIQITYSNDTLSPVHGRPSDDHAHIVLEPGELVTSMTLWDNAANEVNGRTGRIRVTTNHGQVLDVGRDTSSQPAFDVNIGSGILVGFIGRCGNRVDNLAAIFLRSAIAQVTIDDVVYTPDITGTDKGIQPVALGQGFYSNPADSGKSTEWNFGGSESRTQSTTYSQTSSNSFGKHVAVEVSGKIFGIGVKVDGGWEWKEEKSHALSNTVSSTTNFSWGASGTLDPGESCTCTALVQRGEGRMSYSAKVTVKLQDGTTNTFKENGEFQNVLYTQVSTDVKVKNRGVA